MKYFGKDILCLARRSPSVRRAWIEIIVRDEIVNGTNVTLREEGVD